VWTKEQCKEILTKERVTSGKTREQFWEKLLKWHGKQYEQAGAVAENTRVLEVPWADDCLIVMQATEHSMGFDDTQLSYEFAKALFIPLRELMAPPEPPKKKSMFDRLKEKQS
jgi:hypothetical protein